MTGLTRGWGMTGGCMFHPIPTRGSNCRQKSAPLKTNEKCLGYAFLALLLMVRLPVGSETSVAIGEWCGSQV